MNITAKWTYMTTESNPNWSSWPCEGAAGFNNFAYSKGLNTSHYASSTTAGRDITFDGKAGWTGETSSVGASNAHNNMPPYIVCSIWNRVN